MIQNPDNSRQMMLESPDCVVIRTGGGCIAPFGLFFFLPGIFLLLAGARFIPFENADEIPGWAYPLIFLLGVVFSCAGGWLAFGRIQTRIDRVRSTIEQQWRILFFTIQQKTFSLSDYDLLSLRHNAGDSDTPDTFPISLQHRQGEQALKLMEPNNFKEGREDALFLSRFCDLPLEDRTTDHPTVLSPANPAPAFHDHSNAKDPLSDPMKRPTAIRSIITEESDGLQIKIPFTPSLAGIVVSFAVILAFLLLLLPGMIEFFIQTDTPNDVQNFFKGFVLLFFIAIPLAGAIGQILKRKRSHTTLFLRGEHLVLEEQGLFRSVKNLFPLKEVLGFDTLQGVSLPQADLEHLESTKKQGVMKWLRWMQQHVPSKGIMIKTTSDLIPFGQGLPEEEVRYLHSLLSRKLSELQGVDRQGPK